MEFLYSRLPVFHRTGTPAYKKGLGNITKLCDLLGNPQQKFDSIHIAGTNGKGSVSHYLASILYGARYKRVGLHTSPHLKDFRERIKVDGEPITEKEVVEFVNRYRKPIEEINCSFFELSVAMTFWYFAKKKCEIAVIETGMGGRFDSTNILNPLLSIITNISFDHITFLGDTLAKIAGEKAGIIKPGVPVIIGESVAETKKVFLAKAKGCNSPITFADKSYRAVNVCEETHKGENSLSMDMLKEGNLYIKGLKSQLTGNYQLKNLQTVLASVDAINKLSQTDPGGLKLISKSALRKGIARVVTNTGLLGRWQILGRKPLTIADTGHNEAGIKEVVKQLGRVKYRQLHIVFGMVNDKDISTVLAMLPRKAKYYFCKADIPRALEENLLAEKALKYGLKGECFNTVRGALKAAQKAAAKEDLIFIGGSTFVVAEAL